MYEIKLVAITSTALALSFILSLYVYKRKRRTKSAVEILNYWSINIVENELDCDGVVAEIRKRCIQYRAVGFDCEWVTEHGKRQPVALLQISTYDGFCGLFRLNKIEMVPASLKDLLEDEKIYKVGVAPVDDAKYIAADYSVFIRSTLDIRHIVELCGYNTGGLAALSLSILGVELDKSWRIRCSDWAADKLSDRQMHYAAADAHVAIKIFVDLINSYNSRNVLSWFWKKNNIWDNLDSLCWKYADVCFKSKTVKNIKKRLKKTEKSSKKDVHKNYHHTIRTKPLYHNCFLQAPDGELLCTCDNKKALWYVEKQLADIISEQPLTVRLRFEPSGRSVDDADKYYMIVKENQCVVCGKNNSYIRKNVVPREYRKYFPDVMKDHSSHDILLLCVSCHRRSNALDRPLRDRLAQMVDAKDDPKYIEERDAKIIRSAASALLHQSKRHVLPEERRKELENRLLQHYTEYDEVTEELLLQAVEVPYRIENTDYQSHGYKVTQYFLKHDGLLRLEQIWREHFLQSMNPKYLPELWSVKHNEERLRVRLKEGRLSDNDAKLLGMSL